MLLLLVGIVSACVDYGDNVYQQDLSHDTTGRPAKLRELGEGILNQRASELACRKWDYWMGLDTRVLPSSFDN